MRISLLLIGLVVLSGCGGSKSSEPVDLSIDNPKQADATSTQLPGVDEIDAESVKNARKLLVQAARMAKQGLVGKSIELLSHAISMNPEDPELYIARAEVYGMMREDASALADYSTAIRVRPTDASIHNRRGFFLLSRKEHSRALKEFSAAIKLKADSPQAFNNRGLVYLSTNQTEKAIADFGKAVTLNPKYADGWNNKGFAQYKQGSYPEALKDLSQAIALKTDYVNALNNRGLVYLAQKNYESAIADLTTAITAAPYEIKLFQARRSALIELERFREAQQDASRVQWLVGLAALTKEMDQEPLNYQHYIRRGDYLMNGDEFAAAVRDYSKAAQLNNQSDEPIVQRATALLALGEAERSIQDCNLAIQMTNSKQAYSVRGDAWMSMGEYDKAIADFEQAERFDSSIADAYLHRAAAFEKSGDKKRAKADRDTAAAIDPSRKLR